MEHKKTYFITGIDTDAGKTWVTGAFARYLVDRGQSVVTQKIAQTGCVGTSEDIERHRLMMGTGALPEDAQGLTCPFIFTYPVRHTWRPRSTEGGSTRKRSPLPARNWKNAMNTSCAKG